MATIRATVNAYGCYTLDVKFDIGGTDECFSLVKAVIKQVIPDYNPTDDFWKDAVKEALNDEYHCTTINKVTTNRRNGAK